MVKTLFALAGLLATTGAYAQAPPIAYAEGGSRGDAIYLVNPDGTGRTKVYQGKTASRTGAPINRMAMRSNDGGGEIAFIESERVLMVQPHLASGQPDGRAYSVNVPTGSSCILGDLDYLMNGTLVVADSCGQAWAVAPEARTATRHFEAYINSLTALENSILFVENGSNRLKSWGSGGTTDITTVSQPANYIDATATKLFLSDTLSFHTVQLSSPYTDTPGCTRGGMTEVSPAGSQIVYIYRGFLMVHSATCSGSPVRVGRDARSFAWRTY
jgi:hypothetical protein